MNTKDKIRKHFDMMNRLYDRHEDLYGQPTGGTWGTSWSNEHAHHYGWINQLNKQQEQQ